MLLFFGEFWDDRIDFIIDVMIAFIVLYKINKLKQ